MTEKFTFFWNGPFSQWHFHDRHSTWAPQIKMHGMEFNCAEQYMMWRKATLFKDTEMADRIMASHSPHDMKMKYGRNVKNFDADLWNAHSRDFVFVASVAKFSQNPVLFDALAATSGTTLVEASPHDKIWGIGLGEGDPRTLSRDTWEGTNWLGEVLTNTRLALIGE